MTPKGAVKSELKVRAYRIKSDNLFMGLVLCVADASVSCSSPVTAGQPARKGGRKGSWT